MKKLGYFVVLVCVCFCSFVSAGISISEPLDVYNLGDRLYIDLSGLIGAETGNLNIDLNCGNRTINLVRISARSFSADEEQSYSVPYKVLNNEDLEILNLTDIVGTCQMVSSLGTNVASTKTFTISNDVAVSATLDKAAYNPGESIRVDVEAVKANGVLLDGFVEGHNASDFSKAIEGGFVDEIFSMPDTIEAGIYYLTVRAYDMGRNGILNEGSAVVFFSVNQVASSLVMSLSDEEVVPGNEFSIGAEVYDQSGMELEGTVSIRIISPTAEEILANVQSGEFSTIEFDSNSSMGTWKIVASFDDIAREREFEMLAVQKVDFDFEDSVLTITNVGNVLYNKSVDVQIGNETITLDLNIKIGEVRKFDLDAPTGEYEVLIGDGDSSITRRVLLTGNAISVNDLKEVGIFKGYSVLWIFLIIVLGSASTIFFMRYKKTKVVKPHSIGLKKVIGGKPAVRNVSGRLGRVKEKILGKFSKKVRSNIGHSLNFTTKSPKVQGLDTKNYSHEDKSMVDLTKSGVGSAESSLVLTGEKNMSTVIVASVKNNDTLNSAGREALHKIIEEGKGKGLVDWRDDYVFVVFSPVITRTYNNESLAAKAGMDILKNLNDYNRKFKSKVEFNLGVHAGDLIVSKDGGKLKYTSVGNTISLAKRISDSDSGKLIVSDVVRKKLLRDLKVVKGKDVGNNLTYEVSEIKNRAGDAARLKDLMKRMG